MNERGYFVRVAHPAVAEIVSYDALPALLSRDLGARAALWAGQLRRVMRRTHWGLREASPISLQSCKRVPHQVLPFETATESF